MKTRSEEVFEGFLTVNNLPFQKIEEVKQKACHRPDYLVQVAELRLVVEVKELAEDDRFGVAEPSRGLTCGHMSERLATTFATESVAQESK